MRSALPFVTASLELPQAAPSALQTRSDPASLISKTKSLNIGDTTFNIIDLLIIISRLRLSLCKQSATMLEGQARIIISGAGQGK